MSDNFKTTDRTAANVDLGGKDIGGGVLVPRSILTKADGTTDINPATEANQATANAALAALVAALADPASETTLAAQSAKLPAALGSTDDSGSLSIAHSTEGKAAIGALNETAPGTDTASSGLNGRLQRIAQRITSLIALLPASLGPKAGASSLSVVEATPTASPFLKLTTSATGTTFVAFPTQACEELDIVNAEPGAVDIEIRRGGSGETLCIPAGTTRLVRSITDASDIQARRSDLSDTPAVVKAEAIKQ